MDMINDTEHPIRPRLTIVDTPTCEMVRQYERLNPGVSGPRVAALIIQHVVSSGIAIPGLKSPPKK